MKFFLFFFFSFGVFVMCSTNNDIYYSEKVVFDDCHYYIIHLPGCKEYNPWIKNSQPIADFAKMVYDKYCPYCMSEDDVAMFDAISKRNIEKMRKMMDGSLNVSEYSLERFSMYDEAERGYELDYVYNDKTHKVEKYKHNVYKDKQ